ncbi:MAG: amidohydrolase family protein [Armatimonadetes bacterium]|nr:amidohydrolase family protein [Armatimonadota bacterium]
MIVDSHLHWYPGRETHDPEFLMKSGVVNRAWMLSSNAVVTGQATDDEVLALHRKHPDFFVPFAWLDFRGSPRNVDDLHARGFVGLKAEFPAHPYDHEGYFPLYERAERLGMPIVFHTGGACQVSYELLPMAREHPEVLAAKNMLAGTLDLVAKTFRKLKIIAAHLGGWPQTYGEGIALLHQNPNCYLDNSALVCHPDMLREVVRVKGPTRVLWGSDSTYQESVQRAAFYRGYFKYVIGDEKAGELVLGGNAQRILAEARASATEG